MSWLFSRALVVEYSAANCSDGEQSVPLKSTHTVLAYSHSAKTKKPFLPSRYGMTFGHLTEPHGDALLMWFRAVFRAKTSAQREKEKGSKEIGQDCGWKWRESSVKYDLDSHSWKTRQFSLFGGLDEYSETWPRSGTMRNGECWELPMLARHIEETEYGYWPTPTVSGNYNRKGASKNSGDGLATAVMKYPTPTVSMKNGWSKNHNRANTDDRLDYKIEREAHETKKRAD